MRALILVASTNFLINPMGGTMDALMQRELRFKDTMRLGMLQGLVVSALSIVFVVLGAGVWSFIYPHVIANTVLVLMRWRMCSFRP
ncbi:MAG: oligosaccharide flippase family protein, partial [Armatimonadetes bacterium]|nr:oligosaccharide flippase family protein [Armatimonadota bacterium]